MKKFLLLFILFFFIYPVSDLPAITYIYAWVNGDTSHVLTQGDMYAWEFDVETPGSTALAELYLDLDNSKTLDDGDFLLQQFELTDGQVEQDGPSDSSSVPDGIVYIEFGPFGFHPQNYVMKVVDADQRLLHNLVYYQCDAQSRGPNQRKYPYRGSVSTKRTLCKYND